MYDITKKACITLPIKDNTLLKRRLDMLLATRTRSKNVVSRKLVKRLKRHIICLDRNTSFLANKLLQMYFGSDAVLNEFTITFTENNSGIKNFMPSECTYMISFIPEILHADVERKQTINTPKKVLTT